MRLARANVWEAVDQGRNTENYQLWTHMMLSNYFTGIVADTMEVNFGVSHPTGPFTWFYVSDRK